MRSAAGEVETLSMWAAATIGWMADWVLIFTGLKATSLAPLREMVGAPIVRAVYEARGHHVAGLKARRRFTLEPHGKRGGRAVSLPQARR
jgi:hypothetical protein